jgi:hypothetical protein
MIYNFIWGGKKDRIKPTDLCKDYSKGGLAMIDIEQYLNISPYYLSPDLKILIRFLYCLFYYI